MQRSIATVSLSGTLPEKLGPSPPPVSTGWKSSRTTCFITTAARATYAGCVPTWTWRSCYSSRSATSRAAAGNAWGEIWSAPNASST